MDYKYVLYAREDGIATLTLNRPEVLNALNWEMVDEIQHSPLLGEINRRSTEIQTIHRLKNTDQLNHKYNID